MASKTEIKNMIIREYFPKNFLSKTCSSNKESLSLLKTQPAPVQLDADL